MTLKSEDESTPGSEGWPFLRMHYIKVCDPVPLSCFHCPESQSGHHLHMTPVCGVSGWCVWEGSTVLETAPYTGSQHY